MRMGLDVSARNNCGQTAFDIITSPICLGETGTGEVAVHRLMLSKGVYDEIATCKAPWRVGDGSRYLTSLGQMMTNVEVFESFLVNVFPNFYRWPLAARLAGLNYGSAFMPHHKVVGRLFRRDGRFRAEDLRCQMSHGTTFWQYLSDSHFYLAAALASVQHFGLQRPGFLEWEWNNVRFIIRDIVSLTSPSDFSAETPEGQSTIFLVNIRRLRTNGLYTRRTHGRNAIFPWGPWKSELKQHMRDWLEDLLVGGKDLELYGRAEMAAFVRQDKLCSEYWPPTEADWDSRGSGEGGWKWKGFTYGPRPEDWDLIWEWDPRVEDFVRDFWDWVENPPLNIPGAWVD